MSISQSKFNEAYGKLCEQLGDLTYKRDKLQAEIDKVKALIAGLDFASPVAQQAEKEVVELLKAERK